MHCRGGLCTRPLGAAAGWLDRLSARVLISVAIALSAAAAARADGPAFLVKDINTVQAVREPYEDEPSSYPHDFAVLDGVVYFAAGDIYESYGEGPNGDELWRSDGTAAGTYLVKDINPGPNSAWPNGLQVRDGALYFLADDGEKGPGLWRTNGTGAGTERLAAVGRTGRARNLARLGDAWLFFYADDVVGAQLWRVDDTGTITALRICRGRGSFPARRRSSPANIWRTLYSLATTTAASSGALTAPPPAPRRSTSLRGTHLDGRTISPSSAIRPTSALPSMESTVARSGVPTPTAPRWSSTPGQTPLG